MYPIFEDMTKLQLIAALEKSQHREALCDAAERAIHIGYYEWNCEEDRLQSCSDECAAIFNMTVKELLQAQSTWESTLLQVHPDDRAGYKNLIEALNLTKSHDTNFRIIRNDGEIRHLREIGLTVVDDNGSETGYFGMLHDITSQVQRQQELEYRELLARQTESVTLIGHYLFDELAERYIYISRGYEKILGVSRQQYMDRVNNSGDYLAEVYEQDRPRVQAAFNQFLIDHKPCVQQYRMVREDGSLRWISERSVAHKLVDGKIAHSLGVLQDITEQKEVERLLLQTKTSLEETVEARTSELANTVEQLQAEIKQRKAIATELEFLANHDALTGLPSLRLCKDRLDRSLADSRRRKQKSVVMFLDLDGFKLINDQYGHGHGDTVLKTTADRVKAVLRETDTVARIGGDEFVIILSNASDLTATSQIATILIEQISQPIQIESDEITVSASIGIAVFPDDGLTAEDLIRQADQSMYRVKQSGKNNFDFAHLDETLLLSPPPI
jgi:diguanylate cyclase (GGDEF)-like protein/PAS domain S-box-containing protein